MDVEGRFCRMGQERHDAGVPMTSDQKGIFILLTTAVMPSILLLLWTSFRFGRFVVVVVEVGSVVSPTFIISSVSGVCFSASSYIQTIYILHKSTRTL